MSSGDRASLRRWLAPRLLEWFARARRDLPWRQDRDPYRIWVSEVMLQQTQVVTVIPYFERFLTRFPTLADLAGAEEQEVLRLWEGLGYYRRARSLLQAARQLHASHPNSFPADPDLLAKLPGMGTYTRNAVLSQAFDVPLPILEANTERLLSRFFGRTEDPRQAAARAWLWQAATDLLPSRQAGDFNQALMELGSLVCTPTLPACDSCPLARRCLAFQTGRQETIPARTPRAPVTRILEAAVVPRRDGTYFVVQRPPNGRWAGLWEFAHGPVPDSEEPAQTARQLLIGQLGMQGKVGPELTTIRYSITRYQITMICFSAQIEVDGFQTALYPAGKWVTPGELQELPMSGPQRKLVRHLDSVAQRYLF